MLNGFGRRRLALEVLQQHFEILVAKNILRLCLSAYRFHPAGGKIRAKPQDTGAGLERLLGDLSLFHQPADEVLCGWPEFACPRQETLRRPVSHRSMILRHMCLVRCVAHLLGIASDMGDNAFVLIEHFDAVCRCPQV